METHGLVTHNLDSLKNNMVFHIFFARHTIKHVHAQAIQLIRHSYIVLAKREVVFRVLVDRQSIKVAKQKLDGVVWVEANPSPLVFCFRRIYPLNRHAYKNY